MDGVRVQFGSIPVLKVKDFSPHYGIYINFGFGSVRIFVGSGPDNPYNI